MASAAVVIGALRVNVLFYVVVATGGGILSPCSLVLVRFVILLQRLFISLYPGHLL